VFNGRHDGACRIHQSRPRTGRRSQVVRASLLLSIRACHQALGTTAEFTRYLTVLRTGQKRKRNLMKILDQSGLSPDLPPA
jgi:hypothetical protein